MAISSSKKYLLEASSEIISYLALYLSESRIIGQSDKWFRNESRNKTITGKSGLLVMAISSSKVCKIIFAVPTSHPRFQLINIIPRKLSLLHNILREPLYIVATQEIMKFY